MNLGLIGRPLSRTPNKKHHLGLNGWLAFLRNHREAIAAMDFLRVPILSFSHKCAGAHRFNSPDGSLTGKCSLPYMREPDVSERLGDLLKHIYVPETVARTIVDSVHNDSAHAEAARKRRIAEVQQRLAALRTRMDHMYEDKLDGKIDEEFWARKMGEWREQEYGLESQLSGLSVRVAADTVLTVKRIFELANRAHFLYLTRNAAERGQLLKSVLLNCATDGVSLWPTYRKPFDLIFEHAKTGKWWAL